MKKSLVIILSTIVLSSITCGTLYAEEKDIELEIASSVSLQVPEQTALAVTPSEAGTFGSTYFDVLASTNNKSGYTLTMTTDNTYIGSATNDRIEAIPFVDGGILESTFRDTTDTNLLNHWGISIDNTTSYNPIKLSEIIKTTDEEATGDPTRINIATKVTSSIAATTYTTRINFQLVANVVEPDDGTEFLNNNQDVTQDTIHIDGKKNNVTFGGGTLARAFEQYYTNTLHKSMYVPARDTETGEYNGEYKIATSGRDYNGVAASDYRFAMQDMSSEICDNTTIIPSEIQVLDIRDNKSYWIAKLADGKCWMTQNLDLELNRSKALTSLDTDLNLYGSNGYTSNYGYSNNNGVISWTPFWDVIHVESTETDGLIYGGYDSNNNGSPMSVDPMDVYQVDNYFVITPDQPCNYMAIPRSCKNYFVRESSNTHRHLGDYYSWPAAIASNNAFQYQNDTKEDVTNNPSNSICPKGWRLPTISNDEEGSDASSTNEFARLKYVYGATDQGIIDAPVYMVRGGYVGYGNNYQGSLYYPGTTAMYWSSSVAGGTYSAYNVHFHPDNTYYYSYSRSSLMEVRCIAR